MLAHTKSGLIRNRAFGAWRQFFACAAVLFVHACSAPPSQALRLGINPWVGYDPVVLAREHGLFDPGDLRVIELETSSESIRQLRNGLIDAAGLTLPEAVELAAAGTDIRIVALLSLSRGADAVLAGSAVHNVSQLRNARIGLEDTALAAVMLQRVLEAGGLRRDEVRLVTMPLTDHEMALSRGQVDAVITFEPVVSRLAAAGFVVVYDSAEMPGEVVDVLVVRGDTLAQRPEQVQALLSAFEQGRRRMLANPDESARALAPGADLSVAEYLTALSRIRLFSLQQSAEMLRAVPDVPVLGLDQLSADLKSGRRMMLEPEWTRLFAPEPAALAAAANREARR